VSTPSGSLVRLDNGQVRVCMTPDLGAGLMEMAVLHRGRWEQVLRPCHGPATDPEQLACCVLMPWSNRLYGSGFQWRERPVRVAPTRLVDPVPLHGDAWVAPWQVLRQCADEVALVHDARGWQSFPYVGHVRYGIKHTTLRVEMSVEHHGVEPLPYGLGLHPWFVRSHDTQVRFLSSGRWEPDATRPPRHIRRLSGAEPHSFKQAKTLPDELIDHAYLEWDGTAEVLWPSRGLAVCMQADPIARNLVVYSPAGAAGANFVCLEPVTHAPDAHRAPKSRSTGLVELRQGGRLELAVTLTAAPV
jgi:aldose 1-epimerase